MEKSIGEFRKLGTVEMLQDAIKQREGYRPRFQKGMIYELWGTSLDSASIEDGSISVYYHPMLNYPEYYKITLHED
jgi:hypothetical protein